MTLTFVRILAACRMNGVIRHERLRILTLCSLFLSPQLIEANSLLPYQSCSTKRKTYTHHVTQQSQKFDLSGATEATNCTNQNCQPSQTSEVADPNKLFTTIKNALGSSKAIPPECFLASALRGISVLPEARASLCDHKVNFNNHKPTGEIKHCIDESYLKMITKSFSDLIRCLEFTKEESEGLFNLINHESGFILNARSHTKARCFGQLTTGYVKEINRRSQLEGDALHPIYNRAMKACPGLKTKMIRSFSYFTCRLTHDPYSCLLYMGLGMKLALSEISQQLNQPLNYMGPREFPSSERRLFQLPINLDEMLALQVKVNGIERDLLFWDDIEIYDFIERKRDLAGFKILTSKKVPLFAQKGQVARSIAYLSHNGGHTIYSSFAPALIRNLKKELSEGCAKGSKKTRCLWRKAVHSGKGVSTTDFLTDFRKKVYTYYPDDFKRKIEVSSFLQRIANDSKAVFSNDSHNLHDGWLRDAKVNDKAKKQFVSHIQKVCPKVDDIPDHYNQ